MKKYFFIQQGEEVTVMIDGSGGGFEKMIKTFENAGYTAKEVTAEEYRAEKQKQEKMMLDRDEQLFG